MPSWRDWERQLRQVFDDVDDHLEEKYGQLYTLHPARAKRGRTSSKSQDGLFNVGASFSPGYGSEHGEGYVIEVRMVTLEKVPEDVREDIMDEVVERLQEELPEHFPGRNLAVKRDGTLYKIVGDLDLDAL